MRRFILFLLGIICWSTFFASCEKDEDLSLEGKKKITIVVDTILNRDTIIIHNDSTNTNDTIIKTDTIINQETVVSIDERVLLLDFDTLSYENIIVEKAFVIEKKVGTSLQGIAVFNDLLFQTHNYGSYIDVYDLTNNTFAFSIEKDRENSVHCNNADFGPYYASDDPFPLLYLEHSSGKHQTSVYRIIKQDSIYTMEKVQTLNFSQCTNAITNNDNNNGFMYVSYTHDNIRSIAKINIPDISLENHTVALDSINILDQFDIVIDKVAQDATVYNNKLFQLKGYSGEGEICIYDLIKHKIIFVIDWNRVGMAGEPEGIAWYKDHLIVTTNSRQVYNIYFAKNL